MNNEYVKIIPCGEEEATHTVRGSSDFKIPSKHVEYYEPIKPKAWETNSEVPEDYYYYVSHAGVVFKASDNFKIEQDDVWLAYYRQGRTFRTYEEAEAFSTKERCLALIRQHAEETQACKGKWVDGNDEQVSVWFDDIMKKLANATCDASLCLPQTYYDKGFDIHAPENISVKAAYLDYIEADKP